MNPWLIALIAGIPSGVFYRLGGWSKGNRMYRILGCPGVFIIAYLIMSGYVVKDAWMYLIAFGASAGAISAYWGLDEKPWGYWAHGLGLGLAALPLAIATGHWLGFALRLVAETALICVWSQFTSWDVLEEFGRGFIFVVLTPLLLL